MRILMHVFSNFRSNQLSWTTYGQTATVICILKLMRHQVISGTQRNLVYILRRSTPVRIYNASTQHSQSAFLHHFHLIFEGKLQTRCWFYRELKLVQIFVCFQLIAALTNYLSQKRSFMCAFTTFVEHFGQKNSPIPLT